MRVSASVCVTVCVCERERERERERPQKRGGIGARWVVAPQKKDLACGLEIT